MEANKFDSIFPHEYCPPYLKLHKIFVEACATKDLQKIEKMINDGTLNPRVPLIPYQKQTIPLIIAIQERCLPMIRMLLPKHFDFKYCKLAFKEAIDCKFPVAADILMHCCPQQQRPDQEIIINSLLNDYCIENPVTLARFLDISLRFWAFIKPRNIKREQYFELWSAIYKNDLVQVRQLLAQTNSHELGFFIRDSGELAELAVRIERREVLQVYLKMDIGAHLIMECAVECTNPDIVQMCLHYGIGPQQVLKHLRKTALDIACKEGHVIVVDTLINNMLTLKSKLLRKHRCTKNQICCVQKCLKKLELIDSELAMNVGRRVLGPNKMKEPLNIMDKNKYRNENDRLKNTKISQATTTTRSQTLYDFMFFEPNRAARYTKNENLVQLVDKSHGNPQNIYKHFGFILYTQWRRGFWRRKFMDSAIEVLQEAMGSGMPADFDDEVFKHLSNRQLRLIGGTL